MLKPQGTFCYADLWFLEFLELDWKRRKQALDAAPFIPLSEEDISEPVFQALKSKEGFVERIRRMADKRNREFVEEVVHRAQSYPAHASGEPVFLQGLEIPETVARTAEPHTAV